MGVAANTSVAWVSAHGERWRVRWPGGTQMRVQKEDAHGCSTLRLSASSFTIRMPWHHTLSAAMGSVHPRRLIADGHSWLLTN
jgi:hypothetical protein